MTMFEARFEKSSIADTENVGDKIYRSLFKAPVLLILKDEKNYYIWKLNFLLSWKGNYRSEKEICMLLFNCL